MRTRRPCGSQGILADADFLHPPQSCAVNVHYLLARGTADDLLWPAVERKMQVRPCPVAGDAGEILPPCEAPCPGRQRTRCGTAGVPLRPYR